MCDAEPLDRLRLSELLVLIEAKIAHEIRTQLEHRRFGLVKAKIDKDIAAGFGRFLTLLHFRSSIDDLVNMSSNYLEALRKRVRGQTQRLHEFFTKDLTWMDRPQQFLAHGRCRYDAHFICSLR